MKNIDNKSDEQLLIMQYIFKARRQDYDEKMEEMIEYLIVMITSITDQIKTYKSSPHRTNPPKYQDTITVV